MALLRARLLAVRSTRIRPGLDDKVLADWNGLIIAALVNAAIILDEPDWLMMARRAFDFIAHNMSTYLFRCPNTGPRVVQGLSADEVPVSVNSVYEAITCLAS